ncbi:hypothetical protein KVR01_002093 [Diaporthe batatas]|uniref:uncharacterized protein n=1 Tax=Diaporthe batatas TaxID=748121 RepID=UPI001D05924D|nr:uncharacterized protein KVR01_002093 [Diaporthe batatas]KAG8166404.1 hypothetical protein KVR01_002093 [Diaporthe batatas]
MAQANPAQLDPTSAVNPQAKQQSMWRRIFGQGNGTMGVSEKIAHDPSTDQSEDEPRPGLIRRVSRKVVPGLPRTQTFKRQQDEVRNNLEPVEPTPVERRAVSVDRRLHASQGGLNSADPRASAPDFIRTDERTFPVSAPSIPSSPVGEKIQDLLGAISLDEGMREDLPPPHEAESVNDTASMTTSQYDAMIHEELERIWILNLSMHFRDKSKREKFFVTYREKDVHWRRVTISLDYRNAPDNSLEMDLLHTKFQRDKSAKIYEAIRESLVDIQFYDTVTNLKLQTTDGRLHVHVVEDINEIIHYPTVRMIQHLGCRRIRESSIDFDSHMSGFVYKVRIRGQTLIKKEIPGPDTVDEFLYEINALSRLSNSRNVIAFHGVIVDDYGERVKGLLISYAEQGALIDILFDHDHALPWFQRERWARQIVEGLSEIHESGFVQGDFTLSNIVVDDEDNAKIIDINRRGCPVGWEPPEATPLIESNQRISMYIGVKSDLYQLGMVLWALAEQEDEPETHGRPLRLSEDVDVPEWYRTVVSICLADDPRHRMQAIDLLRMFPQRTETDVPRRVQPSISVDDGHSLQEYVVDGYQSDGPRVIRTVQPPPEWSHGSHTYVNSPTGITHEPYFYPTRGRSPPSPMPSDLGGYRERRYDPPWSRPMESSFDRTRTPTESDVAPDEAMRRHAGPDTVSERNIDAHEPVGMAEKPPIPELVVKDESAAPVGTYHGCLNGDKQAPLAEISESVEVPTARPPVANHLTEEAPLQHAQEIGRTGEADKGEEGKGEEEDASPKSMGINSQHENETLQSTQPQQHQFPLFEESGNTEPEAPGTLALVPGEAQVQKHKSTRQVLAPPKEADESEGRAAEIGEQVDSAIEMTAPPPHHLIDLGAGRPTPAARHGSSGSADSGTVPPEFLGIGSGHDASDSVGKPRDIDGDLVI